MLISRLALPIVIGVLAVAPACYANSVAVTSGPNGTTVVGDQPCRVITHDEHADRDADRDHVDRDRDHGDRDRADRDHADRRGNSTSITAGGGSVSGMTTVSPGDHGSSVTVGSGSGSSNGHAAAGAGSDCVIERGK
jgi:hypothetical protein